MNVLINLIVVIIHNVYRYQIFTLFKLNIYTFYLSVNYTSVELGMGRGKKEFYLEGNGEEEKTFILSTDCSNLCYITVILFYRFFGATFPSVAFLWDNNFVIFSLEQIEKIIVFFLAH